MRIVFGFCATIASNDKKRVDVTGVLGDGFDGACELTGLSKVL